MVLRSLSLKASMESTAQIGHANAMDWQEEVYQKIQSMKEAYLPELNEMLEKVSVRIQQNESLVQVPKEHLEKFKFVKRMLECVKAFLNVSKHNVPPSYRDKIGHYEKKIINIVSFNRPRRPASSLQQGQQQLRQSGISASSLLAEFTQMKIEDLHQ